MQAFPYAAAPMSAGGSPVLGVPYVGAPGSPPGMAPSLTQLPTAPLSYNLPTGSSPTYPSGYALAYQPAMGSAAPAAAPGWPPVARVPGPAALGTSAERPVGGAGGVAGVSMAPVIPVSPPATEGGPHQLPSLPPAPLPQGFPNPFAVNQVPIGSPTAMPAPLPGTSYTTGPQGFLPGLGYFGTPGSTAAPGLPGPLSAPSGHADLTEPFPTPPATLQAGPQPPAQMSAGSESQWNPLWMQLAWQLVQTPAVRSALGEQFRPLVEGEQRSQLLAVAAGYLAGPELQSALRGLQDRTVDQQRFTEIFATALKGGLQAVGLLPAR